MLISDSKLIWTADPEQSTTKDKVAELMTGSKRNVSIKGYEMSLNKEKHHTDKIDDYKLIL